MKASARRKRALDLLVSVPLALFAVPIVAAAAVAIRLRMGRGVLFKQLRAGLAGTPITIWKLRTMSDERDAEGALLPDALRMTRLGRALRATSIDELPQ